MGHPGCTPFPQRSRRLSYLSLFSPPAHPLAPSVLCLLNPSLSHLFQMMANQSKIRSPISILSESEGTTYRDDSHHGSPSPPHFQNNRRSLVKRESGAYSGSTHHSHAPGLISTSGSARHSRASDLASTAASVHHPRQPLAPTSRQNRHPQTRAPAFPSYEYTSPSDPDVEILQAENDLLRQELDSLHDQIDTISYVLNYLYLYTGHSNVL